MTWVTLCSNDMSYTFPLERWSARLNKLAKSWTAEPPFVQTRAPEALCLVQGESRRQGSRMSRDGGGSHSGQISRVKQANQMPIEINFVTAIGHRFES